MGKTFKFTEADYAKAVRKADREIEIAMYGKLISTRPSHTHKSQKAYSRKNYKIEW